MRRSPVTTVAPAALGLLVCIGCPSGPRGHEIPTPAREGVRRTTDVSDTLRWDSVRVWGAPGDSAVGVFIATQSADLGTLLRLHGDSAGYVVLNSRSARSGMSDTTFSGVVYATARGSTLFLSSGDAPSGGRQAIIHAGSDATYLSIYSATASLELSVAADAPLTGFDRHFEWPPPTATSRYSLPETLLDLRPGRSYGEILGTLTTALSRGGVASWSVYPVGADGFAVATPMESIRDDGSPRPGAARWSVDARPPLDSGGVWPYIRGLFAARAGRYRVMVFVVTPRALDTSGEILTSKEAAELAGGGDLRVPGPMRRGHVTAAHRAAVLIYEFRQQDESSTPMLLQRSAITPIEHLVRSGIWKREEFQ